MDTTQLFARESAEYLRETYVPRLRQALEILPPDDLFWRPHPDGLTVGTVLLHLEGNVRQWILSGLAGQADQRDRSSEFAATGGLDGSALMERLARTVDEAAAFIAGLDSDALTRRHVIQDFDTTGLGAIYHVVEHFAWHTGQAVWIAKARAGAGHGLTFYDEQSINDAHNADGGAQA